MLHTNLDRRQFIQTSLATTALLAASRAFPQLGPPVSPPPYKPAPDPTIKPADKPLKLLVLGGTIFLGPAIVEYALARGHTVTLFNRGKSNPHLFPELEKLRGDRVAGKLDALKGRDFDAVIDTFAYVPQHQRQCVELLKDHCQHFTMVSTINVYADDATKDQDETAKLHDWTGTSTEVTGETYGPMKAACEKVMNELMPNRCALVRPSLIMGPRDGSDRFSYWPLRCQRGGDILAPVSPDEPVQVIDSRDLGAFCVTCAENKLTGPYNALGAMGLTMGKVLQECIEAAQPKAPANIIWADLEFLAANNVQPWSDLPAWVPSQEPSMAGLPTRKGQRALGAGLKCRPIKQTALDIFTWWKSLPESRRSKVRAGLTPEREAELIKLWNERKK
jgi:2'-hydroxyisoflavone reductase